MFSTEASGPQLHSDSCWTADCLPKKRKKPSIVGSFTAQTGNRKRKCYSASKFVIGHGHAAFSSRKTPCWFEYAIVSIVTLFTGKSRIVDVTSCQWTSQTCSRIPPPPGTCLSGAIVGHDVATAKTSWMFSNNTCSYKRIRSHCLMSDGTVLNIYSINESINIKALNGHHHGQAGWYVETACVILSDFSHV